MAIFDCFKMENRIAFRVPTKQSDFREGKHARNRSISSPMTGSRTVTIDKSSYPQWFMSNPFSSSRTSLNWVFSPFTPEEFEAGFRDLDVLSEVPSRLSSRL